MPDEENGFYNVMSTIPKTRPDYLKNKELLWDKMPFYRPDQEGLPLSAISGQSIGKIVIGPEVLTDYNKEEYNDLIRRLKDEDIETSLIEEIRREQKPEDKREGYRDFQEELRSQGYKEEDLIENALEAYEQAFDEITKEDIEWYDKNTVREQLSLFEYETKPGEKVDVKFQPSKPPSKTKEKIKGFPLRTRQYVWMSDTGGRVKSASLSVRDMDAASSVLSKLRKQKQENALKIAVDPKTIKDLKEKFGHEEIRSFIREFAIAGELEALTEGQAKQILRFTSLDNLRDRVPKEGYERVFPPDEGAIQRLIVSPAIDSVFSGYMFNLMNYLPLDTYKG